jgi:ATP-dependent exoDNAse (exonuclease V) beta subunit
MTKTIARRFSNQVIRASAGTGKTFQLSNRFIALACSGAPPEQILAVTFARKAAGEILGRVVVRLAEAAIDLDKSKSLADDIAEPRLDQPRSMAELRRLAERLHRLRIGTLDSFFIQLARHFSLELGMSPGWQIVDEIDDQRIRSEAIRAVLERKKTGDVVSLLQLLSKGEVTRSVTSQIWDAVGELYTLYRETPKEAWHGLDRPKELTPEQLEFAREALAQVGIPQNQHWVKARDKSVQLVAAGEWQELISAGIAAKICCGESKFQRVAIEPEVEAAYQPLIKHARAVLVTQLANQTESTWSLLDDFHTEYERLKLRRGHWRFDDVSRKLADSLSAGKLGASAYRLDSPVMHLLLDEFQDTSLAQWDVVRPFAEEVTASGCGTFFCVGDVKQAIYGWRGGLSEIFDTVVSHLPGLEQTSLKKSFRSSQTVIDTVNMVFETIAQNAALSDDKTEVYAAVCDAWRKGYESHTTAKTDLAGHCRLSVAPRGDDQRAETLKYAADEVRRLAHAYPDRTIGVLVRTNQAVARLIYLLRNHPDDPILASEEGGNPLTDSAAVQLVLSLVKLADHPGDRVARFHVANSHLGPIVGLADHENDVAARKVAAAVRSALGVHGYGRTIDAWVSKLARHCDARELNRLLQFVAMAYAFDDRATTRTTDFITHVEETKVEDPTSARVRVMTVHQAKGLQFDVVVLPQLDVALKGQHPSVVVDRDEPGGPVTLVCRYTSKEIVPLLPPRFRQMFASWPEQVVNESLCLLYVAMTRAVHALHMIIPPPAAKEATIPKTFAGILRSSLVDEGRAIEPGAVLFERGTEAWNRGSTAVADKPPEIETLAVKLRPGSTQARRSLTRQSPSAMQGGTSVDLKRRMQLDNGAALTRGTLFHAWFECVDWLDDGEPTDAQLHEAAPGDVVEELKEFRKQLRRPAIRDALGRSAYTKGRKNIRVEALREQAFIQQHEATLIRGAIDRLVLIYEGDKLIEAEVLDFKTDQVSEDAIADKLEHYRPQLDAYRRAAAQYAGLEMQRVTAKLVFVVPGVVHAL